MGPAVSFIIATRNRRADLLRTLEVMAPALLPGHEVVVLDDASEDGTAEAVAAGFPEVRLLRHGVRTGYIAARNELLDLARGELAISLDDDAEIVTPGFLDLVAEHFETHPRCGVAALRIFWGRSLPDGAAAMEEPRRVQSFVGCGHVWRLEAWRSLPPYPAWFEMYGEEAFASYELLRRGWTEESLEKLARGNVLRVLRRAEEVAARLQRERPPPYATIDQLDGGKALPDPY